MLKKLVSVFIAFNIYSVISKSFLLIYIYSIYQVCTRANYAAFYILI